ncbi:hypothetical protein JCGZ_06373 [Jatropha curcas]|uniref:Uncharacterized protein n=1 Tax=Jatropha curcas TaxID=180498 RepID=A0A067L0A3_JATCU|nr:hypothetical protein JCGZ_06373 [Jatropha curcas]
MSVEELQAVDENNETALIFAAVIGATRIAECLVRKTMKLVTIAADSDLPVIVACNNGHKETTRYLYSLTPFEILLEDNGAFGSLLLHASIFSEMFGDVIFTVLLTRGFKPPPDPMMI